MQAVSGSPVIESGALTPVVELALGHPIVGLSGWTVEQLHSGSGDNLGVYRVAGTAAYGDAEQSWSVILKVLGKPEQGGEIGDWNFWLREPCLYQSALAQELPEGLAVPRYLGVLELPEGRCWLWLEDIAEDPVRWSMADYGRLPFDLGQFHAPYVAGRRIPPEPWLSRGWLRTKVEAAAPVIQRLPDALRLPMVRRAIPPDVEDLLLEVWADRHDYLRMLDQLPQVLCHLDVFRRNVLVRHDRDEYALVDWAYAGVGALGEELVPLVKADLFYFEVEPSLAAEVERRVLAGYVDGLRAAGWQGDTRLAELGYSAAAALRYTLGELGTALTTLSDERSYPQIEQILGRPMHEVSDAWAEIFRDFRRSAVTASATAADLGF